MIKEPPDAKKRRQEAETIFSEDRRARLFYYLLQEYERGGITASNLWHNVQTQLFDGVPKK